jgi:hypothetical protein
MKMDDVEWFDFEDLLINSEEVACRFWNNDFDAIWDKI